MKYNLLIISVLLFLVIPKITFGQNQIDNSKKTVYYFCTSRAWNLEMVKEGKQEILYTEIKSTEISEGQSFAFKWSQYAQANSKYEKCTGDVFLFYSLEKAKVRFDELIFAELDKKEYKLVDINLE
jgi:competence protein ComGC